MTYAERFVGIDVSKARLDACLWPEGEERAFANDRQGLRDLVRWLRRLQPRLPHRRWRRAALRFPPRNPQTRQAS